MQQNNVIPLFPAKSAGLHPAIPPIHELRNIEAAEKPYGLFSRRLFDDVNTNYATYFSWQVRWGNFLKELVRMAGAAGRDDLMAGKIRIPDIVLYAGEGRKVSYEISFRDGIRLQVPAGPGIHKRAFTALRAARLAHATGLADIRTGGQA